MFYIQIHIVNLYNIYPFLGFLRNITETDTDYSCNVLNTSTRLYVKFRFLKFTKDKTNGCVF